MLKSIIVITAALALTGCGSSVSDLSVTNRSLNPVQVTVGQRSVILVPGQTSRLAGIAIRPKSQQVSFQQNGKAFVFREPDDSRRAASSPHVIWFGNGRLALKV